MATPRAHRHDLQPFEHTHVFDDAGATARSRALGAVTWLTLVTMLLELAVGSWSGSMALLADGWHMGTHAAALGGAVFAARLARSAQQDEAFAFGGWKIEVLAAYTSGLLLLAVSAWIALDAVGAWRHPRAVAYEEALVVALVGLAVNVASVWMLERGREAGAAAHAVQHGHDHGHAHGDGHGHHHDYNFHAAYVHVLADALTSLLAIVALAAGAWAGWYWLDPLVALVAAVVIGHWSIGVLRRSARALLDASGDAGLRRRVRESIECDGDARLADLHVWQVGARAWSVVASVVADRPLEPAEYRQRLATIDGLRHVTVEVHRCRSAAPHA